MKLYPLCDPYVWEDISVIRSTGFTVKMHPAGLGPCASELVNHILFMLIVGVTVGGLLSLVVASPYVMPVAFGLTLVYISPAIWGLLTIRQTCDGGNARVKPQVEMEGFQGEAAAAATEPAPPAATAPTAANPFMNVTVDEIKYNPQRPAAEDASSLQNRLTLDDFFRTEFNRDAGDVFGKNQSQRQFVTMPATTIPNDQGSFAQWLYGNPGKTCKEGGREACLPGTDGAPMPWLNADR